MTTQNNGWGKWENHVLAELTRLATNVKENTNKNSEEHTELRVLISDNKGAIRELNVKSGVWGLFGGSIPYIVTVLGYVVYKFLGS